MPLSKAFPPPLWATQSPNVNFLFCYAHFFLFSSNSGNFHIYNMICTQMSLTIVFCVLYPLLLVVSHLNDSIAHFAAIHIEQVLLCVSNIICCCLVLREFAPVMISDNGSKSVLVLAYTFLVSWEK